MLATSGTVSSQRAFSAARSTRNTPRRSLRLTRPVASAAAAPAGGAAPADDAAHLSRRQLLSATAAAALGATTVGSGTSSLVVPPPAQALELAPLGNVEKVGEKLTGLSAQQVADILARNLREGQYFISGDLSPEIFADDCVFRDPTNETKGLSRYIKALGLLFDASYSAVQLRDIRVTGPATIEADWAMGGYLRFPWHPRVEPFEGHSVYSLNADGLIQLQDQTWSISSFTALAESFTPTPGFKTDIKETLTA